MNELSLFSGAGGGLLASKYLLGWNTIGYVEYEKYPQQIIKQRIIDGLLDAAPIFGDIRAFINEGYAESYKGMVDVITAGFPCQPFSTSGKELGKEDNRNMWPETINCIRIIRPKYALLENVANILSHKYIRKIFGDVAESGYDARWRLLSAGEVGAPHNRSRLWIFLSDSNYDTGSPSKRIEHERPPVLVRGGKNKLETWTTLARAYSERFGEVESRMDRMSHGVAHRLDRYKAIGNGQFPYSMAAAWETLTEDYFNV